MDINNLETQKAKSNFGKYYSDPEYRKKHLEYISAKIKCPVCLAEVARCNFSKHKNTQKHRQLVEQIEKQKELESNQILEAFTVFMQQYKK